jgi:hypothetical protein
MKGNAVKHFPAGKRSVCNVAAVARPRVHAGRPQSLARLATRNASQRWVEGLQLGRANYLSIGKIRGDIVCDVCPEKLRSDTSLKPFSSIPRTSPSTRPSSATCGGPRS